MSTFHNYPTHQSMVARNRVKRFGKTGALLAGIGGLITVIFPLIISTGMNSELGFTIKEGNELTKAWLELPIPLFMKVYIFNLENPDEYRRGAKPRVRELGPYTYKHRRWREIISWGSGQRTVKFWDISSFTFEPAKSVGTQSDKITTLNVPVYGTVAVIRGFINKLPLSFAIAPIVFGFVNVLFATHGEGLMKELTVGEFVEGYPFRILDTVDVLTKPLTWFGIQLPDNQMPGNRFGILHIKNYTKVGPYEVYTGQGGTQFLKFIKYKDKRALDFYGDPKCNLFNGTDGTTMGSFLTKDDVLYIFNADACRSIYATFKERTFVKGIPAWRFVLPQTLFASPAKNSANKCFCTTPNDPDMCDGIFDLGPCQMGAPIGLSFPHFMHTSEKIQSGVEGLNPNPDRHESFFDLEPTIGVPMSAAIRLQVNLLVKPNALIAGFGGIFEGVLPLIWMEDGAGIEGIYAYMFQAGMFTKLAIGYGSLFVFLGGLSLLGYTSVYAYKRRKIIFQPKPEKDVNIQTKNFNPNHFNVNHQDGYRAPPVYVITDGQNMRPIHINPNNGYNLNQQRVGWSPPGTLE